MITGITVVFIVRNYKAKIFQPQTRIHPQHGKQFRDINNSKVTCTAFQSKILHSAFRRRPKEPTLYWLLFICQTLSTAFRHHTHYQVSAYVSSCHWMIAYKARVVIGVEALSKTSNSCFCYSCNIMLVFTTNCIYRYLANFYMYISSPFVFFFLMKRLEVVPCLMNQWQLHSLKIAS